MLPMFDGETAMPVGYVLQNNSKTKHQTNRTICTHVQQGHLSLHGYSFITPALLLLSQHTPLNMS